MEENNLPWLSKRDKATYTLNSGNLPKFYTPSSFIRLKMRQEKMKSEMKTVMNAFFPEIEMPKNISSAHYLVEPIHKKSLSIKTFAMIKGQTSAHTVMLPISEKVTKKPSEKFILKSKENDEKVAIQTEEAALNPAFLLSNDFPEIPFTRKFHSISQNSLAKSKVTIKPSFEMSQRSRLKFQIPLPLKLKKDNKFIQSYKLKNSHQKNKSSDKERRPSMFNTNAISRIGGVSTHIGFSQYLKSIGNDLLEY